MLNRSTNTTSRLGTSAVGATWREARVNEMAAMERLPEALREVVRQNNTNLGTTSVLAYFQSILRQVGDPEQACAITARKLRVLEAGDVEVFAGEYKAAYGVRHVPDGISIMRYGALRPRRRHPAITGFGMR